MDLFQSVIVKSVEENSPNMYEARRQLLGIDKEEMPPRSAWNAYINSSIHGTVPIKLSSSYITHAPCSCQCDCDVTISE